MIIVDDVPDVCELLSIMLSKRPDIELVGTAANVDDALKLALRTNPDLVLLDIQMPGKDGFEFIEEMHAMKMNPGVIFITAFENYAIRAIKNAAIDYLLKPIKREDLNKAIDRFMNTRKRSLSDELAVIMDLMKKQRPERIKLNTRTGYYFLDPMEIFYVEADGNYSKIFLISGKSETSTISLGSLEKIIKESSLLRVSRSYIVNMQYISRVDRRLNLCELEYNGIARKIKIPASKIKLLEAYY